MKAQPVGEGMQCGRQRLLAVLLPLLVACEFVESGSVLFAAGRIGEGLAAGSTGLAAVLAVYAAAGMLAIGLQQQLTRQFGYRHYLIGSLALFIVGALASVLAPSLATLLLARGLQGLGGGALFTSGRLLLPLLFPAAARGVALRRFIVLLFALSAIAPLLAAGLLQAWGWQAVFAAPLPLALLCLLGVLCLLPEGVGQQGGRSSASALAVLLLLGAAGLLQLGLSEMRAAPLRAAPLALALLVAGLLLALLFMGSERRQAVPLLPGQRLRQPAYLTGLGLYLLYYLISSACAQWIPALAERRLGLTPWLTGLLLSLGAAFSWLATLAYLRLAPRLPAKRGLLALGAALMGLACAWLALLPADASWLGLLPALLAKGAFGAWFVLPLAGQTFREMGDEHFGAAYQRKNLLRHLALPAGSALAALALALDSRALGAGLVLACCALAAVSLLQRQLR